MRDLAATLSRLPEAVGEGPIPGHEYVQGWGVFGQPFDSGHVLAVRVFPQNSFAPSCTVWHRDPDGRWSIYVDGPSLGVACPRYFGPACAYTGFARIDLTWTGPASLRVTMDSPALDWTLTASAPRYLAVLNAVSRALPSASWQHRSLLRARERVAQALGMGALELTGTMPSGHTGTLMPQQMYFVEDARAVLDGLDLGRPVRLKQNPRIGDVPLPARGVLAVGQGVWQIRDPIEYERLRADASKTTR